MSWTLIEHQALTSSVASVTLGSGGTIPQTYKTLKLSVSIRNAGSNTSNNVKIQFNGSGGTAYSHRFLYGTGSAVASYSDSSQATIFAQYSTGASATSNTFGSFEVTIPNYAGSTNKPVSVDSVTENNATAVAMSLAAGLWSDTTAITSIVLSDYNANNLVSGSTFTLYGLA